LLRLLPQRRMQMQVLMEVRPQLQVSHLLFQFLVHHFQMLQLL
jgi:hypothetical protein